MRELESLAKQVIKSLKQQKMTLSTAESCTGGMVGSYLTSVAGSSEVFLGGIISYSNQAKINLLKVPDHIIESHGAVSEETAYFMTKGAAKVFNTDFAISTTGIAGPNGGSKIKPVGTVWFGLFTPNGCLTKRVHFKNNNRTLNRLATTQFALDWLSKKL